MKIIIPGGTGQVGQILARSFLKEGHDVVLLSRTPAPSARGRVVYWDGESRGEWCGELNGADLLINLAGRSVNCRYHAKNRAEMMDSRVRSTRILRQVMQDTPTPPAVWMNASTATIYRHALDRPMDEVTGEIGGNEPGAPEKWNFSIAVAKAWEEEFFQGNLPGVRRVALRSAMTMSPDRGGVFDVMLGLVRVGLGGTNGTGRQYVSWIHEADFISAIRFIHQHPTLEGAVNVCSPNPLPNREFMRTLRRAWGISIGLPATAWMMEIGALFLKTETELVLKSRRVVPSRLLAEGFQFQFPHWPEAARELCDRARLSN